MTRIVYHIVEHDGGWAYKLGDVFSETFATHKQALLRARIVAIEQQVGGETAEISYQDASGAWLTEHADGGDRPEADVVDSPA
jgi:hypothetical protein